MQTIEKIQMLGKDDMALKAPLQLWDYVIDSMVQDDMPLNTAG